MNIQLLKRLYSIYSPSGKEQKMVKFLCSYIRQLPGDISVSKDKFGNLYVVKGKAEVYPCLVSHIDQVSHCKHSKDFKAVETREVIFGYSPKNRRFENLGADDKNGVFICLECLKKYNSMKVVFFREEETGCKGSSEAVIFFDFKFKAKYLAFISCLLEKPDLSVKTALKSIFRKSQVRSISEKFGLNLNAQIVCLSPSQWVNCFLEMLEVVPEKFHPS